MNPCKFALSCFINSAALLLLPLSAFADPQLTTTLGVSSCWEDSSITSGDCQNYNHNQTAPPGTSLSDNQANSEDPWAHAAGSVQVFYGSCHMDGSSAALESQSDGILGSGGDTAGATWNSQMAINSPGLDGQTATVRITFHGSGDAAGSGSNPFGSFYVSYSYFVGDGQNGVSYGGTFDANGWSGDGPPTRTFTFDATCTIGQPCEIAHQASFSANAGTGEPDFGDPQNANAQASGSLRLSSGSVQVLDPNNDNQPVSYTMTSNVGCGAGQVLPAGAPYVGFNVTNCGDDRFGSTFSIVGGTASQDTNVTANFVAPPEIQAASDVVDLKGTDGDLQVIQIDWDPPKVNFLGPLVYLDFCFLPIAHGTKWTSATLGNYSGPPPTFFGRAYNPATDFHLGYYGIDQANHKVWAVINHNSLFAAAIPFDLVSVVSRKTHGAAGTFDINMPLTGTPGVECRSGGASGNHTLVFTFKSNLASGEVSVTNGVGSIANTPTMSANTMTVNLTGVTNAQRTTLTLHNMKDVANQLLPDTTVTVGFLLGDTSGNGLVTSTDVSQTKLQSGHAVTSANFREDINANGSITGTDVSIAKLNVGSGVP